jgi:uncharacterized small protein (DUF1192 family)
MKRYEIRDGSQSKNCCFEATVVDTMRLITVLNGLPIYEAMCECSSRTVAERVCDALNANEEYKEEISRLKAELKRWKDARDESLACEKLTLDELDELRKELRIAHDEIERLRAKMDL